MNNEVTNFMWYMYNRWGRKEAIALFGQQLGEHIYDKYLEAVDESNDYNLVWYAMLDEDCRQKIVDRANEIYS